MKATVIRKGCKAKDAETYKITSFEVINASNKNRYVCFGLYCGLSLPRDYLRIDIKDLAEINIREDEKK